MTSRTLVPSPPTSSPITFTVPEDGLRIVQSIIRRVVFPDPFGPRITIISPWSTLKSRLRRASVLPYFLIRLTVSTAYKRDRCRDEPAIKMFNQNTVNSSQLHGFTHDFH